MPEKPLIAVEGVSKYYTLKAEQGKLEQLWALKNVSFEVGGGRIVGIIGRNGAGKTTLLNIIAGTLSPSEGDCSVSGTVRGLFQLGVGFQDELTGRENIFLNGAILGVSKQELLRQFDAIVAFSELGEFIDRPLGSYSQGMRLRLAFSIIANTEFDLLVIDEVLAVGDALFRDKCLKQLIDFKRKGRTLVISTQDMDLIERLCDEVVLLDHGAVVCKSSPAEAVNRYRGLLESERFYVGPYYRQQALVSTTKRWSQDRQLWGKTLGTHEVLIDSVSLCGRWGLKSSCFASGRPLSVRVDFTVREEVRQPHFGVAFFREDGVYCYGPNTGFDGYYIPSLKKGRGRFEISFERFDLARGAYRCSIAIWDTHETVAYDYRAGYYAFKVNGRQQALPALLAMPATIQAGAADSAPDTAALLAIVSAPAAAADRFLTGQRLTIRVNAAAGREEGARWLALYTDDGIFCQGFAIPAGQQHSVVMFEELALLPGGYELRLCPAGSAQVLEKKCFGVSCTCQDHGIIRLKHRWTWRMR